MADEELGVLNTIRDLKHRDPFVPFRVTLTSGEAFLIENSDLLALGKSQVIYCLPKSDRVAHLRLNQIASIQELESRNSGKRKR